MLMNNMGLPYSMRQHFQRGSPYRNLRDLKQTLAKWGNDTCLNHPCEWDEETRTLDCSYR